MNLSLDDYILQSEMAGGSGGGRIVARSICNGLKKSTITFGSPSTSGKIVTTRRTERELGDDVFKSLDEVVAIRGFQKPVDKHKPLSEIGNWASTSPLLNGRSWGGKRCLDEEEDDQWCFSNATTEPEQEDSNGRSRDLEDKSQDEVDEVQWPKGLTPYQIVCYLANKGMVIELKIGRLQSQIVLDNDEGTKNRHRYIHLWRCMITCGEVKGVADSCRRIVTREMASYDFLNVLRKEYPESSVPCYDPPQEIFFHPKVCEWVKELGAQIGSELRLETMYTRAFKRSPWGKKGGLQSVYVSTFHVGDKTYQGVSAVKKYSIIDSARKVWEFFTGEKFPLTRYLLGVQVECDPPLIHDFKRREVAPYDDSPDLNKPDPSSSKHDQRDSDDESDPDDEYTFPVLPFSKFLTDNPSLIEKLKSTKEDEVRKRMRKN